MKHKDFCIFILTHGRPDRVYTYKTLKRLNCTYPVILILDDTDPQIDEYKAEFEDNITIFRKKEIAGQFDIGDNFNDLRGVTYARNASFKIAQDLGYKYFMQLDDDYTNFYYKFNNDGLYGDWPIKNIDGVLDALLDFLISTPSKTVTMAQGGDFIGGKDGSFAESRKLRRKAMNTFIFSTEKPIQFMGRINEDVNAYTSLAHRGDLFFTVNQLSINQLQTQSNIGGLTEIYLDEGTYIKSFYSVMFQPSSVKVSDMGHLYRRLHHRINWNNTVPKILSEETRKA